VRGGTTARGRRTRARIVAAAADRFQQQGYVETTMAAIADAADVSVQTLYVAFGSKVAILAAVHDAVVGGGDPSVPVLERAWVDAVRRARDARRALGILVPEALDIVERVHPIYAVVEAAAADADVAALLTRNKGQRLDTMRVLAGDLSTKRGFARGLPVERAADVLYVFVSDELYRLLVLERQWSRDDWMTWTEEEIAQRLAPG
jgi:AcrR family transcriptional regulator